MKLTLWCVLGLRSWAGELPLNLLTCELAKVWWKVAIIYLNRRLVPLYSALHLLSHTIKEPKTSVSMRSLQRIDSKILLQGKRGMIFEISALLLWILETLNYPCCHNNILNSLVRFRFEISCEKYIRVNGGSRSAQILVGNLRRAKTGSLRDSYIIYTADQLLTFRRLFP